MDIEDIDDNSSQEVNPAPTALPKKQVKTKKDAVIVPPSISITRFFGPPAPPSRSAWEDVNRQCPVCQQTGFSSRSLAMHVNACLDSGNANQAVGGESTGAGGRAQPEEERCRAGNADGFEEAAYAPPKTGRLASSNPSTSAGGDHRAGAGVSKKAAGPRAVAAYNGEQQPHPRKSAKKLKRRHAPALVAARPGPAMLNTDASQSHRQDTGMKRSHASPLQPRSPNPTQPSPAGATQPTPARRRGLLARPRAHNTASDTTRAPPASAVNGARQGSEEPGLEEIARAQLSYVLQASVEGTERNRGWLGTQLFPPPGAEGALDTGDPCVHHGDNGTVGDMSVESGAAPDRRRTARSGKRRVRARPASWGESPSGEQRGWRGLWPDGGDGDCWGDGDGFLTLRPFPPCETVVESGSQDEGRTSDTSDSAAGGVQLSSKGKDNAAPVSRVDRFLEVFARLQPARRALHLEDAEAAGSSVISRAEDVRARLPPGKRGNDGTNAAMTGSSKQHTVPSGSSVSERAIAAAETNKADQAKGGSCQGAGVGECPALETMGCGKDDAAVKQRTSTKVKDDRILQDARGANRHPASSPEGSRSPGVIRLPEPLLERDLRGEEPAHAPQSRHGPPDNSGEPQRRSSEEKRIVKKAVDVKTALESPKQPPLLKSSSGAAPAVDIATCVAREVPCGSRQDSRVTKASLKENSRPNDDAAPVVSRQAAFGRSSSVPQANVVIDELQNTSNGTNTQVVPIARALVDATVHERSQQPPPHQKSDGSGALAEHPARAPATGKRVLGSNAGHLGVLVADAGCNRGSQVDPHVHVERETGFSSQGGSSRSRGAREARLSSGLLRSVGVKSHSGHTGRDEGRLRPLEPVAGVRRAVPVYEPTIATSSDMSQPARQGYEATVAQKGSLTVVDPDHGATLRSNWSIDDSEELGKLAFGDSLDYDAVWYLSPADEDCVGVLRYRIVPHHVLAPLGGWISERGRLRDDPYIIAKATPASDLRPTPSTPEIAPRPSRSYECRDRFDRAVRKDGSGEKRRPSAWQGNPVYQELGRRENAGGGATLPQGSGRGPHTVATSPDGHPLRPRRDVGTERGTEYCEPEGKKHGNRSLGVAAVGGSRRVQPGSTSFPDAASSRGGFGLTTGSSVDVLRASDSGDRVKCPSCHQGMDHWKSGQRQQHVHGCLLKGPSSATKASPSTTITKSDTPIAARATGSASRSINTMNTEFSGRAGGSVEYPNPPRDSVLASQSQRAVASGAKQVGSVMVLEQPMDREGSPRSRRVSLQGVFSPKPARRSDRASQGLREAGHHRNRTASARPATSSATTPLKETVTSARNNEGGLNRGIGIERMSASRRTAQEGVPVDKVAVPRESPSECPVCSFSFGGRLGQWERQAHIQQCLENLDGVFDSEE